MAKKHPTTRGPRINYFRYDEDWSYLADPSRQRTPWLDALKYVPLRRSGWYPTIGGEIRERFELLDQPAFGVGPEDTDGYFLQRYLLSSNFHLGQKIRFYAEFQSGPEDGPQRRPPANGSGPPGRASDFPELEDFLVRHECGYDSSPAARGRIRKRTVEFPSRRIEFAAKLGGRPVDD